MNKVLNNFLENNVFYRGFIDSQIFDINNFYNFVKEIKKLSDKFIKGRNINSDFVSFLLDMQSQLLMSIYEDKHKYLGISKEDGEELLYNFIFFMIDFVNGKRKFEDYLNSIKAS